MSQQLSMPFAEKLDQPLAELCNGGRGLAPSQRVPILVVCDEDSMESVADHVKNLGGAIRHTIRRAAALATWLPIRSIEAIASDEHVRTLELEQTFTIA